MDVTEALTASMTKGVGTILWMAPELFRGGTKYGPQVDVYVNVFPVCTNIRVPHDCTLFGFAGTATA